MSDESYPIGLRNNLLTQEHYEIIGSAIWVYMWLYDRITEEYEASGEVRGRVLGGAVIKARAIAETFGVSEATARSHIQRLKVGRYITARQAGDGFQLEVRNSHKRRRSFTPNTSSSSGSDKQSLQEQQTSRVEGIYNSSTLEPFDSRDPQLCNSREPSNKTLQLDQDIAEDTPPAAGENAPTREMVDPVTIEEAVNRWAAAASVALRNEPPAIRDALRGCFVRQVIGDSLQVTMPHDRDNWSTAERLMPKLQAALRMDSRRPLHLVMVDPNNEARDGPGEVSANADAAADP